MEFYKYNATPIENNPSGIYEAVRQTWEEDRECFHWYEAKGFIRIRLADGSHTWERKEFTIYDKSSRQTTRKIDFCLKHLGPETVTRILKEIKADKSLSALTDSQGWVLEYRAAIDQMILQILEILVD